MRLIFSDGRDCSLILAVRRKPRLAALYGVTSHLSKGFMEWSNDRNRRPRIVGINHIALEVGDIEEALAFYGRMFKFELRGKTDAMAFIDLRDQSIALQTAPNRNTDAGRHFRSRCR